MAMVLALRLAHMVPVRKWRERKEEEIRRRDEAFAAKKQKTILDAEKAIDDFYKEYNQKAERNIKQNKFSRVFQYSPRRHGLHFTHGLTQQRKRSRISC